ncbi:MAG: hypothetical protein IEMM0008_1338 [bacterium]|nr:MAG: hypothetical protein IEMM0008_1338 [bacterium]
MFQDKDVDQQALHYFKKAYDLQMQGDYDEAVIHYKKSLEVEATAEAYTFLGWAYSFMEKYDEAISECHKAIRIDPGFGNPYNDIGSYLMKKEQFKEAIPWFEKAKKAKRYDNPEFPYCNLGKVYESLGLWPLAIKEYRKALELYGLYKIARLELFKLEANLN